MQIAAAHAGRLHLDHHVMGVGSGIGELHQFQSALAREYNTAHDFLPLFLLLSDLERKIAIGNGRTDGGTTLLEIKSRSRRY
jgi:hypothetical protein